jgi:hypothetical protein
MGAEENYFCGPPRHLCVLGVKKIFAERDEVLDCGGKRSATPLFDRQQPCQSGVARRFPPQMFSGLQRSFS